jgi:hypothetical protein
VLYPFSSRLWRCAYNSQTKDKRELMGKLIVSSSTLIWSLGCYLRFILNAEGPSRWLKGFGGWEKSTIKLVGGKKVRLSCWVGGWSAKRAAFSPSAIWCEAGIIGRREPASWQKIERVGSVNTTSLFTLKFIHKWSFTWWFAFLIVDPAGYGGARSDSKPIWPQNPQLHG